MSVIVNHCPAICHSHSFYSLSPLFKFLTLVLSIFSFCAIFMLSHSVCPFLLLSCTHYSALLSRSLFFLVLYLTALIYAVFVYHVRFLVKLFFFSREGNQRFISVWRSRNIATSMAGKEKKARREGGKKRKKESTCGRREERKERWESVKEKCDVRRKGGIRSFLCYRCAPQPRLGDYIVCVYFQAKKRKTKGYMNRFVLCHSYSKTKEKRKGKNYDLG